MYPAYPVPPCTALYYPALLHTPGTPCTPADTMVSSMPAPSTSRREETALGSEASLSLGRGFLVHYPGQSCHPSSEVLVQENR